MIERVFKFLNRTLTIEFKGELHEIKPIDSNIKLYPYQLLELIQLVFGLSPYGSKKYAEEWLKTFDITTNDKYWISWGPIASSHLIDIRPMAHLETMDFNEYRRAIINEPIQAPLMPAIREELVYRQRDVIRRLE